jgi:hypothetical protein
MAAKNFRIFLSPQSREVKLETLVKSFVKRLELQSGHRLYWQAAEHYNTAHPHAHIIINGTDRDGKDVYIEPDLIKKYMRESARDICTAMIGSRTKTEMKADKERQPYADRWTRLDEKLNDIIVGNKIYLEYVDKKSDKDLYINRIGHLQNLGLCEWKDGCYRMKENWEEELRIQGRYNCYFDAQKELDYTNKTNLRLYKAEYGKVTGRITKIYKTDDVSDNHAILLEGIDGKAYFIPLFYKPEDIMEKDAITLSVPTNQKGRLRPYINQRTIKSLAREIQNKGYKNPLSDTVMNMNKETEQEKQEKQEGVSYD